VISYVEPKGSDSIELDLKTIPFFHLFVAHSTFLNSRLATTLALLVSHQLSLFHVKLFFMYDFPFVKTAFAKGLTLVFVLQ